MDKGHRAYTYVYFEHMSSLIFMTIGLVTGRFKTIKFPHPRQTKYDILLLKDKLLLKFAQ